jgi:D-aspartate ligase
MPKAIVLSCLGGSPGDLNVVRALGRAGVPVSVISESNESLVLFSKYCNEAIFLEHFTVDYQKTLDFLIEYAKKQGKKAVLFPTADPDLKLLSDLREELGKYYHLVISRREIIDNFMDKRRFFDYAIKYKFPIPHSFFPKNIDDVLELSKRTRYPAIIKPAIPSAWTSPVIEAIVNYKKAIIIHSREELINMYKKISEYNNDMIVQEYIPGRDDNHYDLHVYMDKNSDPVGYFTGRKVRIYPAYAGTGCFVQSIFIKDIIENGIQMLNQVNYTGLANFNFKKDSLSNEFKLLEINPRISSWNILPTQCGVNLPFIAYADTVGIPFTRPDKQKDNVKYVFIKNDFKAFLEYRKNGDWTLLSWLYSLRGQKVYQMYAPDDIKPFIIDVKRTVCDQFKKIVKKTK